MDQWLWVDPKRGLVYFMGLRDGPLNSHLYVTSYRRPGSSINRLTKDGYSHSVFMNKVTTFVSVTLAVTFINFSHTQECTMFVTVFSNTQSMPACQVVALDQTPECVRPAPLAFLVEPAREFVVDVEPDLHWWHVPFTVPDQWYQPPELFSHVISSGDRLYGMIFRPHNFRPNHRYPTILNIYGGPEVQLVTNTFKVFVGKKELKSPSKILIIFSYRVWDNWDYTCWPHWATVL